VTQSRREDPASDTAAGRNANDGAATGRRRPRWLPGAWLAKQLGERQADARLGRELDRIVGQTIDEL